jgi:hypothetical protein
MMLKSRRVKMRRLATPLDDPIKFTATRRPESDVSVTSAKRSLVQSSTTVKIRNLRPSVS